MSKKAHIIGTGSYLPQRILSNQDLEKLVDTTDEWIVTRTGMKERRIADVDEFSSDMGKKAALMAVENAGIAIQDIDLILVATITPDHIFPSTACFLQAQLGADRAAALDVQAACTGYLYALSLARAHIVSGAARNVLIVATEKLSSIVDYTDRGTCILFGDGASACIVSSDVRGLEVKEMSLGADGVQAGLLSLPAGGCRMPASMQTVEDKLHYLRMDGKEVFKHAVRRMEHASKQCMEKMGLSEDKISWLVPHQANMRIIEALAKRFSVPMEKVFLTIHKYGNTSASSIGIALDELLRTKTIGAGENVLLAAFGAGLTWGAGILTMTGEK